MSLNLQYNYAHIDPATGRCTACMTFSYAIDHPEWVEVDVANDAYIGKYYFDGAWYADAEGTIPWEYEG